MQMNTSKGWRGELQEEALKVERKHLTPKGNAEDVFFINVSLY